MAEIMGTGTEDELRRQREAERAAREEQKRQEEQARQAEEQAKQAEADAKRAEEDAKAVQETAAASAPEAPEIPDMNAQFQTDVDAQWANTKKKRGEQHFYTIEQQMAYEQENAVTPRAMRADEGWAEYTVDYSSIKTKDELSLFMAGTEDDSQIVKAGYAWAKQNGQDPEEVLAYAEYYIYDQYGRELFKNPYSNGAKIRKANGVLSSVGLLTADGEALDMDSASPSQIVSSIRMEVDKKKHDAAVDAVMAMCGIPGSPFYGMSISKDDLAFLDSADMTQKEFSDITDGFEAMFTLADEPTKENADAYEIAVLGIDSMDKPPRVKKQLYANLAEAYAERTGFVAPSAEDILTAREQRMADEAGDPAEQGGGFFGWVKGLFTHEKAEKGESATGDGKTPEELLAELEAQEKGTGYGGGSAPASSAPASSYAAAGNDPAKVESAVPGAVAPSPLDVPSGMEGREAQGPVQQESGAKPVYRRDIAYDPNMTDAQALAYYRSGATLDAANMQQIAWAVDDPDVVDLMVGDYGADAQNAYAARGIGVATPAQGGGYAAASGANAPKFDVMHAYRKFGSSIGNAAHMLSSGAMDAEMASEGYLALASVVREAKGLIENPENGIVIPKGVNQYDHVLSLYPGLANRVQGVLDAQKGVNEAYTQNALRAKEERQATLDSYTTQIQAGKGTPEMAAAVAAAYGGDYADIEDDETRAVFRFNLSERSGYFRDDGAFWQGDSAAAQEGQRLRQMGRGYGEYKADLKAETERLIDEYATAAHKMGLPLEQFLAGAGIDGVGQMIDIAYNAMQAEGNAYRDDPQAQEAMEALETTSVGKLGAAGYGAAQGAVGTTAGYAQTLYMALDEVDYHEAVANLTEEYTTKYGPSAPQMYYSDVMTYANSGALSQEATEELLDKASRAANIFDLGFEIDTNLLEGAARLTYNELQKVNEQLEGVIARMPEDERRIATMAGSFVGSIEEGMVALTVGKAAGVLGAGAKAANLIGSAVGFGAPSFSATYDEGRQMGMSPGMAGRRAFGRSVITSALNTAGTGTQMDIWFGETGYRGMLDAMRSGGKEVAKTMGRAVLRSAHQEGKEELEELAAEKVFDLMDDELLAIDRGAKPSISRMLSSMTNNLMQTDVRALAAEAVESYGMGAAFGSVFTLGGLAKTARSAKRGLNKLTQYESVGLADRMVTGDAAFTEENMGKVFAALQKDLEDPKFRRWLDSADMAARDQNATVTAMLLGTGEAERNAAVDAAGKAAEYGEKAKAAKTASDVAKDHFFEIGARVERGEAKGSEMDAALAQMQKADTALTEAQNAADKAAELAAQKASEWLRACRAQGVTIRAADMQRRATVMAEMRTARAKQEAEQEQAREAGNVLTMEKENFIAERYPDADEETRETILGAEAWNAEQPETDTESENQAIRNAAAFAGQISRRFGVAIEFRDGLEGGALGKYEDGRIILDKRSATQGEVIRRTAVHELTHRAESSAWYGELRETLLDMGYGGDADRLAADVQAKMRTYNDHAEATGSGKRYTNEEIEREIVADLAGELFTADEETTARLVEEKPGLMRRVYEVIRDVVNRLRGVRDPEADKLRRAEKLMRKALDTAEGTHEAGRYAIELDESNWPIVKADRDFVLSDNPKEWGKDINEYIRDEIRQKGEMRIKTLDGDEIILDAKSQRKAKDWLTNGDENDNRVRKNASAHLDEVVAVSEDVAPGKPNEPDDKGKHGWSRDGWRYREAIFEDYNKRRYLLNLSVGVENGNKTVYNIGKVEEIKKKDHTSVSGQLGRVPSSPAKTNDRPASPRLDPSDTIVAEPASFGNRKYSLPDGNVLGQEIEAYRALGRKAGGNAGKGRAAAQADGEAEQRIHADSHYNYAKPFTQQVEDLKAGKIPKKDALIVSGTPDIWQKVGLSALPVTINQEHVRAAVDGTRDTEHHVSREMMARLPELLADPIAIIESESSPDAGVVVLVKAIVNGKPYVAPVYVNSTSRQNGVLFDSNNIATVFRKGNAVSKLLNQAIQKEKADGVGVYYINKTEAQNLYDVAGVQFPGDFLQDGLNHSIFDAGSPVNRKFVEQTETRQFKHWFGDSKVVDERGKPLVMYHGTRPENGNFTVFDAGQAKKKGGLGLKALGKGNYFTSQKLDGTERYGSRVIPAYLCIRKPFTVKPGQTFRTEITRALSLRSDSYDEIQRAMREAGYDGVILEDGQGQIHIAVAFDSNQIKSATQNIGLFDPKNPDIRYSIAPQKIGDGNGQTPDARNTGERQFATKTAQQSEAMPQWLKNDLMADPAQRTYERDSNDAQLMRAWTRYQQEGYEGVKARLLEAKDFSADDIADANMMMAMAFRNDDVATALEIAHKYNTEGTKEGQTLQARKLFQRMTPTGIKAWAGGQAETALSAYIATHSRMKRDVDAAAARVEESIRDKQSGDEVLRLNAAGTFTIDSRNNRWGIPINEQQQALIDHYNLGNVTRPGLFYNRATRKQRMLEAIIATPNPLELTGGGLNLIQRLEYIQEGVAVITNADLDYMGMQLAQYAAMDADSQQEREGDLALSRAYEAYGNIDPASMGEKARTWRYTSMLLSIPSAARNVIGNATQNAVNETAHALAVELDRWASRKTGKRTMAHLNAAEQAEGFRAFAEETVNTFKDFYVDKTVTANMHGDDRFNTSRRGRVYENQTLETLRLAENFLMSVGDRNFWKRAYVNSIAEQQRVAAQNGTALDMEAAAEIAREEANYATFNEDSSVRRLFNELKNNDNFLIRTAADLILPFTGVPTNITRRMVTYSPAGMIGTVVRGLWDVATKTDIDQKRFITDLSRGLTGTALFGVGMALREAGMILLGTGDEDDSRVYGVRAAQGAQYTPYIRMGDRYMSLNMFAPAVSAMTMGAAAMDLFKGDEDAMTALYNASLAGIDQIFDASYLSSLQSIFTGQGTAAERIGAAVFDSAVSQNVPAVLGQLATAIDPYVRDTKDKNAIMQALKTGLIAKIPGLREMVPEKVDVTGKSVVSKEGLRNFFDPTYTTAAADDPALDEMMRLYEATQDSSFMPLDVLSGKKNTLTVNGTKYTLTGKQKEAYKKRYGELWHDEVSKLVSSPAYQRMSDEKKAEQIRKIVKEAKTKANRETALKLGQ